MKIKLFRINETSVGVILATAGTALLAFIFFCSVTKAQDTSQAAKEWYLTHRMWMSIYPGDSAELAGPVKGEPALQSNERYQPLGSKHHTAKIQTITTSSESTISDVSGNSQTENSVAINPSSGATSVIGLNSNNSEATNLSYFSESNFETTNGGDTWPSGSLTVPGGGGDPAVAIDNFGNYFAATLGYGGV
ncbi:MAG: hypothetical protein ACRDF4_07330, partial [Rhabdochlamydiaceae bacterium]